MKDILTPQQRLDLFVDGLNLTTEQRQQLDSLVSEVSGRAFRDGQFIESYRLTN
jgi:Spy/CpxP family protein refolding chaperone